MMKSRNTAAPKIIDEIGISAGPAMCKIERMPRITPAIPANVPAPATMC
jgi:hypothetical protein